MRTEPKYQKKDLINIVDDRPVFRAGIKSIIKLTHVDFEFNEYAELDKLKYDWNENINLIFLIRVGNTVDKVIVNCIRKIKSLYKSSKIILYDYQQPINFIVDFFREKLDAYLPEDFDANDLEKCLNSLGSDQLYVDTQIAFQLLTTKPQGRVQKNFGLTPTEIKVARFLIRGMSPSLIARELDRKISTISTIKSNIFKKTKVSNVIDLVGAIDHLRIGLRI